MQEKFYKNTRYHSPSPIAKKNWVYITSISHYNHKSDEVPFYRNFASGYQMFYTISGEGWVDFSGNYQHITPGTITCVDLSNRHGFGAAKGSIWEHYWIILEGSSFHDLYVMIFEHCNVHKTSSPHLIHQLFKELFNKKKNNNIYFDIAAMSCLMQVTSDLLYNRTTVGQDDRNLHFKSIEAVISFIEINFDKNIAIAKLAEIAGYSQFHFSRIFKEYTGFSPADYIIKTRIEKAKNFLSKSTLPIELIAQKSGFHSPNYFNKVFKERERLTPGNYRKMASF